MHIFDAKFEALYS